MQLIDIRYNFGGKNTHINIKLKVKKRFDWCSFK